MMRAPQLLALVFALLLLLPSCADGIAEVTTDEPVLSASVTEYSPHDTEDVTAPSADVTEEITLPHEEETTGHEAVVADLPPDLILKISEKLVSIYRSYTCTSNTMTEIDILGEKNRSEISSELRVSEGNAHFIRTDKDGAEEFYLIDGYLCYSGNRGKYRFGGYDISSFSELIGDFFPLSAFEDGKKELDGEDIILTYDSMNETGESAILAMLGLGEAYTVDFKRSSLTVRTDSEGNQKQKEMILELSVSENGENVMSLVLTSVSEQKDIGVPTMLSIPLASEFTLFPDSEAIAVYEAAIDDINSFFQSCRAFEFTEKDEMAISSDSLDLILNSKTDYAYAEEIGASIEQNFDLADGTGKHRVLTHFNNRYGFSQIDGGSIFVDKTINANNLFFTLSHPFDTSLLPISEYESFTGAANGKISFSLNDAAIKDLASELLLRAGVSDSNPTVVKTQTAEAFIHLDGSGKVVSFGYSFSARVISGGITYTLSRSHSLDITSRGTANVKVIYIEVDEEDEE